MFNKQAPRQHQQKGSYIDGIARRGLRGIISIISGNIEIASMV